MMLYSTIPTVDEGLINRRMGAHDSQQLKDFGSAEQLVLRKWKNRDFKGLWKR